MTVTEPQVLVEIAKGRRPGESFASMAWASISDDVQSGSVSRGRTNELEDFSAGTFQTRLRNSDRDFDPVYESSPHWPDLLPLTPIRVGVTVGGTVGAGYNVDAYGAGVYGGEGTTHRLFCGFTLGWPQQYEPPSFAYVDVTAADAFEVLAQTDLPESVWAAEIEALGPRAWYRLNERQGDTAHDSGPNGWHGIYQNGATFNSRGSLVGYSNDNSIELNGLYQAVGVPGATVVGTASFGVAAVFSTEATVAMIFDQEIDRSAFGASNRYRVSLAVADGKLRFDAEYGTLGRVESTVPVNDGEPHRVVATLSGASMKLYVDGVNRTAVVTACTVGARVPMGFNTAIGRTFDGAQYFAGTLDEVVSFGFAPNAAQVASLEKAATNPWAGDTTGARINRILDLCGWSTVDRDIDVGDSILGPTTLGTDGLSAIRAAEAAEAGRVWVNPDGKVVFKSRHAIFTDTESTTVQSTWGDGGGAELPWFRPGFRLDWDRDTIANTVTGERIGGAEVTLVNAVSYGRYRTRSRRLPPVAVASDTELLHLLEYTLDRYAEPQLRLGAVTVRPATRPQSGDSWTVAQLWAAALGLEVSERHVVTRRPQGIGGITFVGFVEGVEHRWDKHLASSMETTFTMSPANVRSYWALGVATLGGNTRLSY